MDVSTEGLTVLLDREEIRDCIARLARGLPFSADHYAGRAVGDHSETFFGEGAEWAR